MGPTRALAPAPDDRLHALEQRLLSARSIHMRVRVATSGRIQSHFEGTIDLGEGQRARFALQGAFGQKDVDVRFVSDGAYTEGGPRGQSFAMDVAPAVREGIVLGFVRMGITHDLAMLSSGAATLPVLVVSGASDPLKPASHAAAAALVHARVTEVELPACGHMGWLECPQPFLKAVRSFFEVPVPPT